MSASTAKARRRSPDDEPVVALLGDYDYADSFEIPLESTDERSPEQWMKIAIGGAPLPVKTTVGLAWFALRFDLHPRTPGHLFGMPVVESTPNFVHLRGDSPLLEAHLIGRRADPTLAALTTVLIYKHRTITGGMWSMLGPAHRRIAPYLMERVAAAAR